ncbi:MAG: 23S rRNA (uracil(1939)-C(5))-methyltransferase RlmD [Coriobacteriia bacterium]|nr:23S rRNA (uracil(1939)-C(5))-methyltransferase RlmD [Coriobacteriia bacterium]
MIRVNIESLAYGGDSIARLEDGRTAFVRGGCPGDTVLATIVEDRDRFVRAQVDEIVVASPDRVEPPCPYFGICGGCNWQHVSYSAQLAAKRRIIVDAFQRIGRFANAEEFVAETVPSATEYGYRNKIELVTGRSGGRLQLGYHKAGSDEIVEIESCLLLPRKQQTAPKALAGALRYLSGRQELGIQRVALRVAANTQDVEIALWTVPGPFPRRPAGTTLGQALNTSSIVRVLTKGPSNERRVSGVEVLAGNGFWRERLLGRMMTISAPSFFQVNTQSAESLIRVALAGLAPDGSDRALDLYAGAGTFTAPLADAAGEVIAVESSSSAIRDLRRNLDTLRLDADVIGGDAARELPDIGYTDVALVDPPRAGLHPEVLSALTETGARAIAYVSCDPSTLARDAAALAEHGYAVASVTPVDMFPQTYHVEAVALFTRA